MSNQHKISHITDTLKFTEEQFGRFLVDFAGWWAFCKMARASGAEAVGFTWVDDDQQGQIHHVEITDPATGEQSTWPGPAALSRSEQTK